jgi:hypothetical protein
VGSLAVQPNPCPCGQTPAVADYGASHGTEPGKWYHVLSPCGWHQGEPMRSEVEAVRQWNGTVGRGWKEVAPW